MPELAVTARSLRPGLLLVLFSIVWMENSSAQQVDQGLLYSAVRIDQIHLHELPTVRAWVSVAGPVDGTTLSGLSRDDFELELEGQRLGDFRLDSRFRDGARVHLLVAIDLSGSMADSREALRLAYIDLVSRLGVDDRLDVVIFSESQQIISTNSAASDAVLNALEEFNSGGDTALFDALMRGLDRFVFSPDEEPACLLLSDGWDTRSGSELEDVVSRFSSAGLPVFPVVLGEETDSSTLRHLARETHGGLAHLDSIAGLGDLYDRIADRLQSQYILTFDVPQHLLGRQVSLGVRVTRPVSGMAQEDLWTQHTFLADSNMSGGGPGDVDSDPGDSIKVWVLLFGVFLVLGNVLLLAANRRHPIDRPTVPILVVVALSGLLAFLIVAARTGLGTQ